MYLNRSTYGWESTGLDSSGETVGTTLTPSGPLGVESSVPLHLSPGLPAQLLLLPHNMKVSSSASVWVTSSLHSYHCAANDWSIRRDTKLWMVSETRYWAMIGYLPQTLGTAHLLSLFCLHFLEHLDHLDQLVYISLISTSLSLSLSLLTSFDLSFLLCFFSGDQWAALLVRSLLCNLISPSSICLF